MKAPGQPVRQAGLGAGQVNPAHADLRESQFASPCLNQGYELSAVEGHLPIVKTLRCADEAATQALARQLAGQVTLRQALVELRGDLGAGKTTLVRHVLQALGVQGRIKSPTYAVVEPYNVAGLPIWHFDFYRFNDPQEWEEAGFRDIFASPGLKLVEWPDKAGSALPPADLQVDMVLLDDDARSITLTASTTLGRTLLEGLPE